MKGLYEDQELVAKKFEHWLNHTQTTTIGLWAGAGFGKSFMTKYLVDEVVVKNSNYTPVLTSMTHSAVAVLADFAGRGANTIHSVMGWIPKSNKETGETYLSTPRMRDPKADPRLTDQMLVFIDEAGLVGHYELALLLDECEVTGARVVFIGDNKQCYPVMREGQSLCVPAYDASEELLTLTIPKRVDEGDVIYKLSLAYRNAVDGGRQPKLETVLNKDGSGKGVRVVDDLEEYAYAAFEAGKRDGNVKNIKVLAFTNKRCLNLNRKIRKKVMSLSDPTPIVGEEMVANTAIPTATGDDILIRNNQLLIVKEVEKTDSYGLAGAFIVFETLVEGKLEEVEETVFVPASPGKLQSRLKQLAKEASYFNETNNESEAKERWRTFFSLKEGCADIRFTYAMTVNKAQGTTLKHVLVDLWDINTVWDHEQKVRLAYTAVSRATDYVTIEGELDEKQ